MRTVGIVCEYNPFHTGHKRQIDILRAMGYDCIVCVMSGNYTERGELAILDKYTRAECAIYGGADLVLELPFPYSSFSAEGFANAGVHILASLGIDTISFGSECDDLSLLSRAADAVTSTEFASVYTEKQLGGVGSARSYFDAIGYLLGEQISLKSNDILGISYLAAIKRQGLSMSVIPIKREGADYNERSLSQSKYSSASAIREVIKESPDKLEELLNEFIPRKCLSVLTKCQKESLFPVLADNIGSDILSFFRMMTPDEIVSRAVSRSGGGGSVAEDGCGICERICKAAKTSASYGDLLLASYNSKYTDSRINRVLLFSPLGVSDAFSHTAPTYTTLLGASEVGRRYLSEIRKSREFKVVTKPADAPCGRENDIIRLSDSLYASAIPRNVGFDHFLKKHPFMG